MDFGIINLVTDAKSHVNKHKYSNSTHARTHVPTHMHSYTQNMQMIHTYIHIATQTHTIHTLCMHI